MDGRQHHEREELMDTSERSGQSGENPRIGERVDQIGQDAQRLWEDTRAAAQDIGQTVDLRGRLDRNPYGTLAVAFGVGYLLGGGLFTSTTARVVRMGMRLAAVPLVKDELLHLAEQVLDGFLGDHEQDAEVEGPAGFAGHDGSTSL